MHKWESKSFRKTKQRAPGIKKWQEEWIWLPVNLDSSAQQASSKFSGKILNDDIYECGFCKGSGEKPRGARCTVCGGKKTVSVNPPAVICAYCKGSGEEKRRSNLTCTACGGKGVIRVQEPTQRCYHCRGTGAEPTNKLPCVVCRGSGVITVKEEAGRNSYLKLDKRWQEFQSQPGLEDKHNEKSYSLPSGSEKEVLEVILELGAADNITLSRRMIISPSYANYLCKSLIKAGLLIWDSGKYALTPGAEELLKKRNKAKK